MILEMYMHNLNTFWSDILQCHLSLTFKNQEHFRLKLCKKYKERSDIDVVIISSYEFYNNTELSNVEAISI